ncbi:hypothetical protein DyAD56_16205 [Dyella sp. AD56]|uniref:hypothetical protein n=1 Tax=Dyella sp. AD56 TaxID=1528744 RepID=UPI000C834D91|nr:hypothetical protein [Dyella sp. AD56]PMQ04231.1 hypothetical protein DyAD56_16205 [Dyella sp. AD56]
MTDRARLHQKLNAIEAELPALIREHTDPAELWPAFAGIADEVLDAAGPDLYEWVADKIDGMLSFHGLTARH